MRYKTIKEATFLGWGYELALQNGRYSVLALDQDGIPMDEEPVDFPDGCEEKQALLIWEEWCAEMRGRTDDDESSSAPDWELQAEYDEIHGTINGQDPGVIAMRELWGE